MIKAKKNYEERKTMENQKNELRDIIVGLEQRIGAYEHKLKDLQKKRERLNEEIASIEKYIELAKTLYRVEADKAKLASLSSQIITDEKGAMPLSETNVTDQSREILLGRTKYVGMSVSDAVYMILHEAYRPMHAKELCQELINGGMRIRGKTPVTSVATSLKRDPRLKKVSPNTFAIVSEEGINHAQPGQAGEEYPAARITRGMKGGE